ncbi:MAG: hypothetical protein ACRC7J_03230 [Vibrio ordalii]|uniref:hypothetical protein n=1 Tax=Vibrio ordalii TaxID=28174 RepID=UPI003F33A08B
MCGYKEAPTPEQVATVVAAQFWQAIYPNLGHISIERKAAIYEYAKKAAIAEAKRCFTREPKSKPLD